ncbi:MAG: ABC transporter permease [Christensenellales bacterium]|jgi:putative aldouronate transport system permease protein
MEKKWIGIEKKPNGSTIAYCKKIHFKSYMKQTWILYLFLLPAFLDVFIFRYVPIYGAQIAFRNYKVKLGFWGSDWVGLKYFIQFFESPNFLQILRNTLLISFYNLLFGFPVPILLAFMINEIRSNNLKKITQMITYMPHFISMVAVVGLINLMLNRQSGIVNLLITALGGNAINFMGMSSAYRTIYVVSDIWQHAGWGTIIYLATLATVDVEALEAARIDGANRLQKILYIDLPTILPTIIVLLILRAGSMLNVGFEKVFLLQNDLNREVSEVISTYTYRMGILNGQYSYTTAIGLFNNVVNASLLIIINQLARKTSETSLW